MKIRVQNEAPSTTNKALSISQTCQGVILRVPSKDLQNWEAKKPVKMFREYPQHDLMKEKTGEFGKIVF